MYRGIIYIYRSIIEQDWKGLLCQASRNEKASHQLLMLSWLWLRINAAPTQNQNHWCIKLHSRTSLHFRTGQALLTFQLKPSLSLRSRLVSYWSSARSESVKYVFGTWCCDRRRVGMSQGASRCALILKCEKKRFALLEGAYFTNASLHVPMHLMQGT